MKTTFSLRIQPFSKVDRDLRARFGAGCRGQNKWACSPWCILKDRARRARSTRTGYWKFFLRTALTALGALTLTAQGGETAPAPPKSAQALTFPVTYTGEGLANLTGGYKRGAIYEGLLSAGVQGDLDKLTGWKGASFLVSALYPHGPSLTDNYVHDLNRVSSIDAPDSLRLYEAWVQQEFADGKVSLRLGQILADTEFFVSDNGALFLNGAFGAIPLVSQNFSAPVYPVAAPGVRTRWIANDTLTFQAGIFNGGAGTNAPDNKHGLDGSLSDDGMLALTEAAFKFHLGQADASLPGTCKLGAFFHSHQSNALLPGAPHCADAGGYFIVDQQLWSKPGAADEGLSGFLRIGGAPASRSIVPFYFDTGFNYKGLIPGRAKDIAGLGLSFTRLSGSLRDDEGNPTDTHHETILEATYKVVVKDWLSVQPDLQYIFNPGGAQKAPDAFVLGLRMNLSFP